MRARSHGNHLAVDTPPRVPDPRSPQGREQPRLRPLLEDDLGFVVEQHLRCFPHGFFARLGPRFLQEYYRAFLTGDTGLAILAEEAGRPVGYLVGVTDPVAHREHVVRRHGRGLALRGAVLLAARPRLCATFVRTRAARYLKRLLARGSVRTGGGPTGGAAPAVLTHVAVVETAQGKGIGSVLCDWFEDELTTRGCERVALVTAADGEGAGRFYERRGWRRTGEHATPDGFRLSSYERRLDPSAGTHAPVSGA